MYAEKKAEGENQIYWYYKYESGILQTAKC